MNSNLLKSQIVLKDTNVCTLAKDLNISKSAFYRKLNKESEFTRKEILKLMSLLDLDKEKTFEIFFSDECLKRHGN